MSFTPKTSSYTIGEYVNYHPAPGSISGFTGTLYARIEAIIYSNNRYKIVLCDHLADDLEDTLRGLNFTSTSTQDDLIFIEANHFMLEPAESPEEAHRRIIAPLTEEEYDAMMQARRNAARQEGLARWGHLNVGTRLSFCLPWHDGVLSDGHIVDIVHSDGVCDVQVTNGQIYRFYCDQVRAVLEEPPANYVPPVYSDETVQWVSPSTV